MSEKTYIAIDLKSFYASVECVERGLNPLNTNLVVADESRTEKTICLAVTPSLKKYGISGRARLFEVIQRVREINAIRKMYAPNHRLDGKSYADDELNSNPELELTYITAVPRMRVYMKYSTQIYDIYLRYISPDDIHVYSIDEVFIDATPYLKLYNCTARELAKILISDVLSETGITATAGIGTNLYLCKIAMDIVAKHCDADEHGVRIAELDEMSYRRQLWEHRPITDFWRVGKGISQKLEKYGIYTMGDIAMCSLRNDSEFHSKKLLYRLFGVNAELLIDHAWGFEPVTIADIKAYRPQTNSLSSGQVLSCPYSFDKAKLVMREMTELLVRDLVRKELVTNQLVITVGYDRECLTNPEICQSYHGEIKSDSYGRKIPKNAHGTANLPRYASSCKMIVNAVMELFDRIVDKNLLVRRMYVVANRVIPEKNAEQENSYEQLDFFTDISVREAKKTAFKKEHSLQKAVLKIETKYGKNAIFKGMNLKEGATAIERNNQVGGHKG